MLWTRNGKIITRRGKIVNCDECPCYCKKCHDIQKAYEKNVPYVDNGYNYRVKTFRKTNYEIFYQNYIPSRSPIVNGINERETDAGVTTENSICYMVPSIWYVDEDGWYEILCQHDSFFYPDPEPKTKIFDARQQAAKLGRDGCIYELVNTEDESPLYGDRNCYTSLKFIYPDCKTDKSVMFFNTFKQFNIEVTVASVASIRLGMFYGNLQWYFNGKNFSYSTSVEDGSDPSIHIDGETFTGEGASFPSGTFSFPGYHLCQGITMNIDDRYPHAGNNYNAQGAHTYNISFYLPVVYEDSNSEQTAEPNNIEPEDEIQ